MSLTGRPYKRSPSPHRSRQRLIRLWRAIFFPLTTRTKSRVLRLIRGMITVGVVFLVAGTISLVAIFAGVGRSLPDPDRLLERAVPQSTKIYDRAGKVLLYEIHGAEKRTLVKLEEIPKIVQQATVAAEDKNFYTHRGVALRSIFRAAIFDLLGRRIGSIVTGRPEGAGGASTITQQFAKNAILTSDRTLMRKIKGLILAYQIEKKFSKDQILQLYLNEIPYGSTSYGIESAAQTYFRKSVRDLDLAEAAILAAIPNAPTRLSPHGSHRDELVARQRYVLDQMVLQGMISRSDAEAAKRVPILERVQPKREAILAPHFVLWVKDQLASRYGDREVETGGLRVTTTLDARLQEIAETAVQDGMKKIEAAQGSNAALAALNPKTGEILAMVGSRDFFDDEHDGKVNVTLRPRQPGSSFKPIVYAASFIKGYTPTTVLFDVVTKFKTEIEGTYEPHDYDLKERGPVIVRSALAGSLNIPAVKMIYLTGIEHVLDLADAMGYGTLRDRSRFGLSLVLGGGEVKPLEHAAAFGVFATEGVRHEPVSILKVADPDGQVLEERQPSEGARVMDPEIARNISSILSDNDARAFVFGEKNYLTLGGRPVAAKTGTTNDFHDAWTVGYTPSLVAVVWTGNNNNKPMKRGADGSQIAAPIWNQFMRGALKDTPVEYFTAPAPLVTGKPILDGETAPTISVLLDRASGKRATSSTPSSQIEERRYASMHDTLYYINKDDPRGGAPTDPGTDPQFPFWETALQDWAARNNIAATNETPPTEFDDVHTPENTPSLQILGPADGATIDARSFVVTVNATSRRGVRRVEFKIDNEPAGSSSYAGGTPIVVQIIASIPRGFHSFTVTAFDDVDNNASASININVTADPPAPTP